MTLTAILHRVSINSKKEIEDSRLLSHPSISSWQTRPFGAYIISCDRLTHRLTFFLNTSLFSLHSFSASTLAGDSSLGPESMDMILKTILSTLWTGDQRSLASS
nr:Os01g0839801 [Ipomoea batatas]